MLMIGAISTAVCCERQETDTITTRRITVSGYYFGGHRRHPDGYRHSPRRSIQHRPLVALCGARSGLHCGRNHGSRFGKKEQVRGTFDV